MNKFARSLRPLRGLWWLSRSAFESIQELHRRIAQLPHRDRRGERLLPRVEQLEDRTLLSTINWTNPAGGDWNDPANWDLHRVPTLGDAVAINLTDSAGNRPIVTVTTGAVADTVSCNNPLVIDGGALTATNTISVGGSAAALDLLGGTVSSGAGIAVVGAQFDYAGGSVGGPIVLNSGALAFGTGPLNPLTVTVSGGATTVTGTVPAGIVLDVLDNSTLQTTGTVTNSGTIVLNSVSSTWSELAISGSLTNTSSGVIEAAAGAGGQRRFWGGDLINQGVIAVDTGVSVSFGTQANQSLELDQQSGEIDVAGFVQFNSGLLNFSGGTINAVAPTASSTAGEFQVNNGTIDVSSAAAASSAITVAGNVQLVENRSPNVTIDVIDSRLTAEAGAVNDGTIVLSSITTNPTLALASTFTNAADGLIEAQFGVGYYNYIQGGDLINQGVIAVDPRAYLLFSASNGSPELDQQGGSINVSGFLQLNSFLFHFSGGTVNSVAPTATSSAGEFQVYNGSIDVTAGGAASASAITVAGNPLLVENRSPYVTLDIIDSQLTAAAGAVNDGTIVLSSITTNPTLALASTFTNAPTGSSRPSSGSGTGTTSGAGI
jgi:hypothetical protein